MPNLAPQEQDVHTLLRHFLLKVHAGRPLSYATFREAWQELQFSLIYEVCMPFIIVSANYILVLVMHAVLPRDMAWHIVAVM